MLMAQWRGAELSCFLLPVRSPPPTSLHSVFFFSFSFPLSFFSCFQSALCAGACVSVSWRIPLRTNSSSCHTTRLEAPFQVQNSVSLRPEPHHLTWSYNFGSLSLFLEHLCAYLPRIPFVQVNNKRIMTSIKSEMLVCTKNSASADRATHNF